MASRAERVTLTNRCCRRLPHPPLFSTVTPQDTPWRKVFMPRLISSAGKTWLSAIRFVVPTSDNRKTFLQSGEEMARVEPHRPRPQGVHTGDGLAWQNFGRRQSPFRADGQVSFAECVKGCVVPPDVNGKHNRVGRTKMVEGNKLGGGCMDPI